MAGNKITYLFGAGASYNAVPILNSLTSKMRIVVEELKRYANPPSQMTGRIPLDDLTSSGQKIFIFFIEDLQEVSFKSDEYGTIDTYAKKLELNDEHSELQKLKSIVSIFFVIWQGFFYRSKSNQHDSFERRNFSDIDLRYKSLISNYLIKNPNSIPELDENVNFVSWNYDHQLESALSLFFKKRLNLTELNERIRFLPDNKNKYNQNRILHLNGISNFWINDSKMLDRIFQNEDETTLSGIMRRISELYRPANFSKCTSLINYAWDNNNSKIDKAKRILHQTDILIIIGYSFPTFNRAIDASLLSKKYNSFKKVVYQDPNASKELLELFDIGFSNSEGFLVKENGQLQILKEAEQFYIPSEYFPQVEK